MQFAITALRLSRRYRDNFYDICQRYLIRKKQTVSRSNMAKLAESADSGENIFPQIEKLSRLKNMQVITQEEFEQKKRELLARL